MSKTTAAKSRTTAPKGKKSPANKAAVKTTTAGKQGGSKPKKITTPETVAIAAPASALEAITEQEPKASDESNVSIVNASEHNPESASDVEPVQALNEMPDNRSADHTTELAATISEPETAPDSETETPVNATEHQDEPDVTASEHAGKQTAEDKDFLNAAENNAAVSTNEIVSVAEPKTKQRAKSATKKKLDLGERFNHACAEVSRLRKEFLDALDEKAALLGVERKGEGLATVNPEAEALNAQIKEARKRLDDLLKQKRELKGDSPELQEVNARISRLRKERETARWMKKVAYDEAMKSDEVAQEGQAEHNEAPEPNMGLKNGNATRPQTYESDALNRKVTVPA